MNINNFFFEGEFFSWVVLPILICLARIIDQSIGTLRLIFVAKGYKALAPILAFFEALIWLIAVSQILQRMDNWVTFFAYGLGFALGNYFGIILEQKISLGNVIIRIFPKTNHLLLIDFMREHNFGYTLIDGEGREGNLKIIFSILTRKNLKELLPKINEIMPESFYTIEEVKSVKKGIFKNNLNRK